MDKITSVFDIENELTYLDLEHQKLYAIIIALRDFCKIDDIDPERVTPYNNVSINPQQFYSLNNILLDIALSIQNATNDLLHAVEQYRIAQNKPA